MRFAPLALALTLFTQAAPLPPTPADFGQFERLTPAGERGGLSPDGRWLAYGITRTNGENDLRVTSVAEGGVKTIPFGAQPAFSPTRAGRRLRRPLRRSRTSCAKTRSRSGASPRC
jgi:hypothetical protein